LYHEKAVGRAQVVLLSSHFEKYFYSLNDEAVDILNDAAITAAALPETLRLVHSSQKIDDLAAANWDKRGHGLTAFVASEGWLWRSDLIGRLEARSLIAWMNTPSPKNIKRYFKNFGIEDIFSQITKKPTQRKRFFLGIQDFVDLRNNIAHGDAAAQATYNDVQRYLRVAREFCERADSAFARYLGNSMLNQRPW